MRLLLTCAWALFLLPVTDAFAERDFDLRFGRTTHGDVRLAGNLLTDCPSANADCAGARNGTTALFNNNTEMVQVDIDADASTPNSSRATLALPAGATVLFAGLYWGAGLTTTSMPSTPASDPASKGVLLLDPPGAPGYQPVTATSVDLTPAADAYGAFADVTSIVAAAGPGDYGAAGIQTSLGLDGFAGWALVVAFETPSEPLRNLAVFDGYKLLSNNTVFETVSGFRTPLAGTVRTRVGGVSYEGEGFGAVGDSMMVNGTAISDAQNPANDYFNGSISALGSRVTTKIPDYVNQMGAIDIDVTATENLLANGSSTAQVGFSSGTGDGYFAHALTFATEVQQPLIELTQTVTDVDGGSVRAGDVLEFTIMATNTGNDQADSVTVVDTLPAGVTVVPGSIEVAGTAVTAAADADAGEVSGGLLNGRLGDMPTLSTRTVKFRVRIPASAPVGTAFTNGAEAGYRIPNSAIDLAATAPPAGKTVVAPPPLPALTLVKTVTDVDGGTVRAGDVLEYAITVRNQGDDAATEVALTDPLPAQTTLAAGGAAADLGTIAGGAEKVHTFRVRIADGAPVGAVVDNVADAAYTAPVNGAKLTARSNTVSTQVAEPKPAAPAPTASPTPAPTPTPVVVPLPTFAQVVTLPSARRCVSRRRFRIRLRTPKGETIRDARVFVNGRRVKVVSGSRLRAPVDLRGLPKGRFTVRIEVRTATGKLIKGTRKYRTCVPKRRRG